MRRVLVFALAAALTPISAWAMPPRFTPEKGKPTGPVEVKVRRITEVKPISTTAPPPSVALSGEHRLLVLMVDTADVPWPQAYTNGRYEELVFDRSASSMNEYYRENSYGRFSLAGEVVGPLRVPGRMTDYTYAQTSSDPTKVHSLIKRALEEAAKKTDLKTYDTHDIRGRPGADGIVDHVMILYAERTGAADGFAPIWPHRGSIDLELANGLRVQSYTILNHAARLGVYVHEFGHDLGLPDLYDRDYSSHGVGDWCTMASGSWLGEAQKPVHISAWGKIRLGWIAPQLISKPIQNLKIPSSSERPFAVKIPIGEVDSSEYFLLENRRRVGFDAEISAEGLLIWHIDENKGDNDDEGRKMVDVVEATKEQDLDHRDTFSAPKYTADLFSGRGTAVFDDSSNPGARANDGSPSAIRVRVLTPPERIMAVDISRPEIFDPGGVPFVLSKDGYAYGRFSTVPLGRGSEALVQLDATPGGYAAFALEAFVSGSPQKRGKLTLRLYEDQGGRPGKVLASASTTYTVPREGYGWARARIAKNARGVRLPALAHVWAGVTSDDGQVYPVLNPFSTSGTARYRRKQSEASLSENFNFRDTGATPVMDYVIRVGGFGYLEGDDRPDPTANDADELVVALKAADASADAKRFEAAIAEYERLLEQMEKEPRRYETWIPVVVNSIGVASYELGRWEPAIERFEASLRRAQAAHDQPNEADIHENIAETAFFAKKLDVAKRHGTESKRINAALKRWDRLVENLYWLGRAHQVAKEEKSAMGLFKEAKAAVKKAFAKDADQEAEWNARIEAAKRGEPEDAPKVAERGEALKEKAEGKKQEAKHRDLLQFLSDDIDGD